MGGKNIGLILPTQVSELLTMHLGEPAKHKGSNAARCGYMPDGRPIVFSKNVGKSGYAFNALQRLLLPSSLRPTAATTLAGLQS